MRFSKLSFVILLAALSFFFTQTSFAQDVDTMAYKHFEIGAGGTIGASIFNGTVPDNTKTDVHLPAYLVQAMGIYSFHPYWGAALGIGYESRGMLFRQQNTGKPGEDIKLNYISIQPSVKFKQFVLGVTIGLPASLSSKYVGKLTPTDTLLLTKNDMNTLIDIRIGAILPIVENDAGSFNFLINASWNVSDAFSKGFYPSGQGTATTPTQITKSPIPTVQIGLSYLFAPGGKTH